MYNYLSCTQLTVYISVTEDDYQQIRADLSVGLWIMCSICINVYLQLLVGVRLRESQNLSAYSIYQKVTTLWWAKSVILFWWLLMLLSELPHIYIWRFKILYTAAWPGTEHWTLAHDLRSGRNDCMAFCNNVSCGKLPFQPSSIYFTSVVLVQPTASKLQMILWHWNF